MPDWLLLLLETASDDEAAEFLRDPLPELGHRSPFQALREGDVAAVAEVVEENF